MRKFKKAYLLGIIPVIFILFLVSCPIVNDATAAKIAQTIWEMPLPPATTKLEKISRAGKLVGNGNGMQFFGAMLIQSDASLEDLASYYSEDAADGMDYRVEKLTSNAIEEIEHAMLSFETSFESDTYFVVSAWGDGIFPFCEFDLRGH